MELRKSLEIIDLSLILAYRSN